MESCGLFQYSTHTPSHLPSPSHRTHTHTHTHTTRIKFLHAHYAHHLACADDAGAGGTDCGNVVGAWVAELVWEQRASDTEGGEKKRGAGPARAPADGAGGEAPTKRARDNGKAGEAP